MVTGLVGWFKAARSAWASRVNRSANRNHPAPVPAGERREVQRYETNGQGFFAALVVNPPHCRRWPRHSRISTAENAGRGRAFYGGKGGCAGERPREDGQSSRFNPSGQLRDKARAGAVLRKRSGRTADIWTYRSHLFITGWRRASTQIKIIGAPGPQPDCRSFALEIAPLDKFARISLAVRSPENVSATRCKATRAALSFTPNSAPRRVVDLPR